jgi:hypothetical protein
MGAIKKLLPHLCVILAGMYITFFIIDQFNAAMTLIDNPMAKTLLFVFSIVSVIVSVMLIRRQRMEE